MTRAGRALRCVAFGVSGSPLMLLVVLLALLAPPAGDASAATPAKVSAAASAVEPANEPPFYDVTEVIPRSDQALARQREIRARLDADRSIDTVEAQLPQSLQQLDAWWAEESQTIREGRSVQRFNDVAWELVTRSAQVGAWKLQLVDSGKAWSAESQAVEQSMAIWRATRAAMRPEAPQVVYDRIDEVLGGGEALQALLQQRIARLISVQSRLTAQGDSLSTINAELDTLRPHSARGLFTQDSRPLWALLAAAGEQPLTAQADAGWAKLQADGTHLVGLVRADAALHGTAFAGLVVLFFLLRMQSRRRGAIEPTAAEQFVLDRGVFAALLLTLTLVPLVYPEQSPRILRLTLLPGLLCVLALAPAIVTARWRTASLLLVAIFLSDLLRAYLLPQWLLARLMLLTVSVLGAAGIAVLLLYARRRDDAPRPHHGLIRALTIVGILACAGSAVANLTGNVSLAEYLVSPPIRLLYLAIVIRLAVVVTTTITVMALRSPVALSSRVIRERGAAVAAAARRLIGLGGVGLWGYLALFNLGLLTSIQAAFLAFIRTEWQVGAAVISVRDFIIFVVVLAAAYGVSRMLRLVLAEEIFPRFHFPRGVPDALTLLAHYGVLLFGFLLALSSAGVDLSKVTIALSALGVGIGFGLQNVVNNFVGGLILVFEHPIQVGDYIEVGPHYGKVTRIGFRSSMVLTRDGSKVVIPNSELIGSKVVNWSLSNSIRRLIISVPVAHGSDAGQVIELLKSVAQAHPLVCEKPPAKAVLSEIGEIGLKFTLRVWVNTDDMFAARDELTLAVEQALQEAGVGTPVRQADVRLQRPQPAADEVPTERGA